MTRTRHLPIRAVTLPLVVALTALTGVGCGDDDAEAAPVSDPIEAPEPPPSSRKFTVDSGGSKVEFLMEAPLENIHGVAGESVSGDLYFDLADLTQSRGLVRVDLDKLEVLQRKRESEEDELGEETKDETQNEHMRTWFQISDDTPEEVREANRYIQFNITRVDNVSQANVLEMTGAERTVTATFHGDFRLHARTTQKSIQTELTFRFEGDEPRSVQVRTVEPVNVGLEEHAIHPRSAFDTLAEATLATVGQKVADTAPVTFEFTAQAGEVVDEMPDSTIETSAAAEEALQAGMPEEAGAAEGAEAAEGEAAPAAE